MNQAVYTNFYARSMPNALGATDLTLTVNDAAMLPILTNGDYMYLVLLRVADGEQEIVKVTAISDSTLTLVRAQEGTTALAFAANDGVLNYLTKATLDDKLSAYKQQTTDFTSGELKVITAAVVIPDSLLDGHQLEIYNNTAGALGISSEGTRTLRGITSIPAYGLVQVRVINSTDFVVS